MLRRLLIGLGMLAVASAVGYASALALGYASLSWVGTLLAETRPPIMVGLIHSQSGPLAISEKSLIDAEVMALEEINARGGIAGQLLKWEKADGRSDSSAYVAEARRLIDREGAKVLVGGWTADCRKALLAVVEERDSLLIFPANFEGIEQSPHVVYSGGSANQVILPGVRWCVDALKAKKFYVIGTEEIWSRCVGEMAKDGIKAAGAEAVGETYWPMAGGDPSALIEAIKAAKPDVVLNVLVGDSNLPFYSALRKAGLTPDKLPVVAFNVSEDELTRFPPGEMAGQYAVWSYFQSLDRPESREFVARFKARYGQDRVVCDSMEAAYNGIMIWAQAVQDAGTVEPKFVMNHFDRQSFNAAEGIVTIDTESRTAWRPSFVGKVRPDGQFDVVSSIPKAIHPEMYLSTRSKFQWNGLVEEFKSRWNGRWSAPSK